MDNNNNSQLYKDILKAEKLIEKTQKSLERLKTFTETGNRQAAYKESFIYAENVEAAVNNARLIPTSTGYINAFDDIKETIIDANDIDIDYIDEDIFYMKIPTILPKKEFGNASYIRATVKFALDDYFEKNQRVIIDQKSVIVFKHNYSKERDYREYRDHDNIEINTVVDLLALYVLIDDSPLRCDHYYFSDVHEYDNTEVFVVPKCKLISFLEEFQK